MILKLIIIDTNDNKSTMLFGSSYKTYLDQIKDFFYRSQVFIKGYSHPIYSIIDIEVSNSEWKSWGGLKWCEAKDFQDELNREGCQQHEPDNPNPRKFLDMNFEANTYVSDKINSWYNNHYQGRLFFDETNNPHNLANPNNKNQ